MRITAIVNDDQSETYQDRRTRQPVSKRVLSLVDVGEGARLKQIVEFNAPEEFPHPKGEAIGKRVVLDITEIAMFGNRPRLRGVVVADQEA